MFEIEIRDGLLHIGGYVNAVGRDSKPIFSKKRGRCVEQVTPGAFSSSLADGHEVFMKLNHEKVIATTADGSLELREDNIGLKAQATVSDEEVITMAEKGLLKAWSFGFEAIDDDMEERSGQLPRRHLNRIKLNEVSVLSKSPAYEGTLVELRDGDACEPENTDGTADEPAKEEPEQDETAAKLAEIRTFIALAEAEELIRQGEAEYRAYRDREEAQAFIDAAEAQQWIDEREEEERYNPYHNLSNGQFTTAGGGGMGGILVVPKNGKRYYAQLNKGYSDEDIDDMYQEYIGEKLLTKLKNSSIIKSKKGIIQSQVSECDNFDDLSATLKDKYDIELDKKLRKYEFESVKQVSLGVSSVVDKYPEVSSSIRKITTTRKDVVGKYSANNEEISFSPKYLKNCKEVQAEMSKWNGVYNNISLQSIGAHEAGHALEWTIVRKGPASPFSRDIKQDKQYEMAGHTISSAVVKDAVAKIQRTDFGKGKTQRELQQSISIYSTKNYGETWAEAIADVHANGQLANPLSIEIVRLAGVKYDAVKSNQKVV